MKVFKTTDTLGNEYTLYVKPSTKREGAFSVTMCNQHRYPMCLSNVAYSMAGYAEARQMVIDAATTTKDVPTALFAATKMKWTEVK